MALWKRHHALLALAGLPLAGCSGGAPSPAPAPTTTTQAPSAAAAPPSTAAPSAPPAPQAPPLTPPLPSPGETSADGSRAMGNGTFYSEARAAKIAAVIGPSAVPVTHEAAERSVITALTSLMGYTVDPARCSPLAQSGTLYAIIPSTYAEVTDASSKITYSLTLIPQSSPAPRLPAVARSLQECGTVTVSGAGRRVTLKATPTELTKQGGISYFGFSVAGEARPWSPSQQMYAENEAGSLRLSARSSDPSVTRDALRKALKDAAPKVFALETR